MSGSDIFMLGAAGGFFLASLIWALRYVADWRKEYALREEISDLKDELETTEFRATGWARVSTDTRVKLLALEAQVADIRRGLEPKERIAQTERAE